MWACAVDKPPADAAAAAAAESLSDGRRSDGILLAGDAREAIASGMPPPGVSKPEFGVQLS